MLVTAVPKPAGRILLAICFDASPYNINN